MYNRKYLIQGLKLAVVCWSGTTKKSNGPAKCKFQWSAGPAMFNFSFFFFKLPLGMHKTFKHYLLKKKKEERKNRFYFAEKLSNCYTSHSRFVPFLNELLSTFIITLSLLSASKKKLSKFKCKYSVIFIYLFIYFFDNF